MSTKASVITVSIKANVGWLYIVFAIEDTRQLKIRQYKTIEDTREIQISGWKHRKIYNIFSANRKARR